MQSGKSLFVICLVSLLVIVACRDFSPVKRSTKGQHARKTVGEVNQNGNDGGASFPQRRRATQKHHIHEHHMDVMHGVYVGESPTIVETPFQLTSSEEDLESIRREMRRAEPEPRPEPEPNPEQEPKPESALQKPWQNCLPLYHPCRKHSECCEQYCSWRIGMRCDYAT